MTIKIAVACFTGNSGLTDYSVSLCKELAKISNITLITGQTYDERKYHVSFPAVKIFRRSRQYPIDIFRFLFYVLNNKPDVILFESWLKFPIIEILLAKIFKMVGITTAITIHDLLPHYPKPWSRFELSYFYSCFDKHIVHSEKAANGLVDMVVKSKPLVVPHGVYDIFNIDQLSREQALERFPEINAEDFVVLFFGHIETRKGILEYLAASQLLEKKQDIKFIVAGGNRLLDSDKKVLNLYKTKPNVVLYDKVIPIDEVQNYFTVANVIVLPYLEGTTSGVVKLAMAFDKPIIATDVGDFSETLNDWSGLLINLDHLPKNLSDAILTIQDDYATYIKRLRNNKEKYQWDVIAKQHLTYLIN